jgi:Tfp pilus assembly protein PilX
MTTCRRIRSLLGREEGIALVMALVFTTLLLSTGSTLAYYATTNRDSASASASRQTAFDLAESGLNEGISVLFNSSDPTSPSSLPSAASPATDATTFSGGTINYWGSYNAGTMLWTVYGRGNVKVPNGRATHSHTVSQQVRVGAGSPDIAGTPAWGNIFVDNRNGPCTTLANNSKIYVSLFVTGNLCLASGGTIMQSADTLSVGGTLDLTSSSSSVGLSTAHLSNLHAAGGCRYGGTGSYTFPCTTTQKVWADHQDRTLPNVTKPPVDLPYWYAHAKPGPSQSCTSGSFPSGFDTGDGLMNGSLGTVTIFTSSAYDCVVSIGGTVVGEMRWTPGNPASFYLNGTVFIDGNISTTNSDKVDYTGRGSIYATGSISLSNSLAFCGTRSGPKCNFTTGAWDPEQKLICWVAGSSIDLGSSIDIQGAFYATTSYSQASTTSQQGPIVTTTLNYNSSSQTKWLPFTHLAPGMPEASSAWTAAVVPGTWQG